MLNRNRRDAMVICSVFVAYLSGSFRILAVGSLLEQVLVVGSNRDLTVLTAVCGSCGPLVD